MSKRRVAIGIAVVMAMTVLGGCSANQVRAWFAFYRKENITLARATEIADKLNPKVAPGCDDHYALACYPNNQSDVDCVNGGDGPAWVWGPALIPGWDHYELDPEGDRVACWKKAPDLGAVNAQTVPTPAWGEGADPSAYSEGGTTYVTTTATGAKNLPIVAVNDLTHTYTPAEWSTAAVEGLPTLPSWVNGAYGKPSSPTMAKFGQTYVVFFTAPYTLVHPSVTMSCIGRATSTSPTGPFVADDSSFNCGTEQRRGAFDPQVVFDKVGAPWLLASYGNALAPAGYVGGDVRAIPLDTSGRAVEQESTSDGFIQLTGARPWAQPVLSPTQAWEGAALRNPAMTYDAATDSYLLTYSVGDPTTGGSATGLARCSAPTGPCTSSPAGPWIASGNGRSGPTGLSFFTAPNGTAKVVLSSYAAGVEGSAPRWLSAADVTLGPAPAIG